MKHFIHQALSSFLLFVLLISSASTSANELNEQVINSWIDSQSALEEWGKKHESQLESSTTSSASENPLDMTAESMTAPLKAAGLYESANSLVKKYGFTNINEWASTTLRITKAAAAIEFRSQPELMNNSQLEALRNAKDISPEHKQMLSNAIEQNQAMVKQIMDSSNEADIKAVTPHLERILKMMEEPY